MRLSTAQTKRKVPDFVAATPGKAAFAMLGVLAMVSAGNAIIAENHVPDPADAIAGKLVSDFGSRYGVHPSSAPIAVHGDDLAQITAAAHSNGADRFVPDVQTVGCSFNYFPADWTHYRVLYQAKARLIDVQSESVVAEGFCRHLPDSDRGAPHL